MDNEEQIKSLSWKKILLIIILFIGIFLYPYVRILSQQTEYNQWAILLNGLFYLFITFLVGYIFFTCFKNIKFIENNLKENTVSFTLLFIFYVILALYISNNLVNTFSEILSLRQWNLFPEYRLFVIPTISLSLLFLFRIFGYFEHGIKGKIFEIDPNEIQTILKDLIMGIIIITFISNVFFSIGNIYPLGDIFKADFSMLLPIIEYSFLIAFIELIFWIYKINLGKEIKNFIKYTWKIFVQGYIICLIIFIVLALPILISYYSPSDTICLNGTVLKLHINKTINEHNEFRNQTDFIIPLIKLNDYEAPLTDRAKYLIGDNLVNYSYIKKSLEITSDYITFPIRCRWDNSSINDTENIAKISDQYLLSFPQDYDSIILYSLYETGYHDVNFFSMFADFYVQVFANKYYFNLNEGYNNIAIRVDASGGPNLVSKEQIFIITENNTIAENIRNVLNTDVAKAEITIINMNPKDTKPLNC